MTKWWIPTLLLWCVVVFGGRPPNDGALRVRVLSWNIYHGEAMDGGSNLDAVAALILANDVDLVALQEVDKETTRVHGLDLTAELAKRTGMTGVFGRAMDFAGGEYGEAVLTRLPLLGSKNHALPAAEGAEPRAALEVRVRVGSRHDLLFTGTHLDHLGDDVNRRAQVATLVELAQRYGDAPALLVGDLNAEPDSAPMKTLLAAWTAAAGEHGAPTYPSDAPEKRIDYVLYRPAARFRVVEYRVLDEQEASDHRPVLVVFELLAR